MTALFDERIIPRLEEIRKCFETPDYPYTGLNSDGNFGLDVVEDGQVKTICTIKDNYACIVCCKRGMAISVSYVMDADRIVIDYDLVSDKMTEIAYVSFAPVEFQFGTVELDESRIQYLIGFYQYLQNRLKEYENSSD